MAPLCPSPCPHVAPSFRFLAPPMGTDFVGLAAAHVDYLPLKVKKQQRSQEFVLWAALLRAEGRVRERGYWGRGSEPPHHQLRGLGEHCKLPSGVWGKTTTANAFWTHYEPRKCI